ncbi:MULTISPECIES: penicillin-binding protein 2 [unclassified Sulfitobacter]|uniref:penicillin-binding protein 2 n=1 Tax=unclassified Sulfitobacter TaxID=196795 RepID=UPI0007C22F80|nr:MULTISPECIES: penicillin-binding protein 2 [unclassified Sulfitobacter]KZX93941.1 penicillin-binding protein 2 [Sulfitobacter sp. HI0023]KZY25759.1 penicillin-binding protein 2 [Sulfitobacter sp. HI0040]KZZ70981.1 penicillin-binding protein 2 [Sulfitobacter sp. HI0129]
MRRNRAEIDASHGKLTRRAALLGGAQLLFMGGLAARMRYLQVDQADQFRLLAEENRINIRLIPPARGEIFDRNGRRLAQNVPSYRIVLVREDAGDVEAVLDRLSTLVELDAETRERVIAEVNRSAPFLPVTVLEDVSWDDVSRVSVNAPALPGITPEVGLARVYPRGQDFAHVVGRVGRVSQADLDALEDPDQVLRIPRFQIGKINVEAREEAVLRGSAGTKQVEVNATGRVMRELSRREGQSGADLQLTVDAHLQGYVQARLDGESAAVVVIDCESGDLAAIASAPSYDPNLFIGGISSADYNPLLNSEYRPLVNKTVQGTYPPGSTFKMMTAMAALEEGLIGPEDTVYCPGHLEVAGRRFHCWKRTGHGRVNLENSLKQSCDVYYYDLAVKVGIEKITAMANRFGLGIKHELALSSVAAGLTPTMAWKLSTRGEAWRVGDTVNSSIGQGFTLASPLQLAVMTARLATGREVTPRLVKSVDGVERPDGLGAALDMNQNNLNKMRKAMHDVVNDRRGTAYRSRIIAEDMRMAGKTGTSQVRNITAAERARGVTKNQDLPWNRRDHALFVCFAPYEAPRYAMSVLVEHGGGGSTAAAPIARDVMLQALAGGDPPLEAYPQGDRERIAEQQERLRALRFGTDGRARDRA